MTPKFQKEIDVPVYVCVSFYKESACVEMKFELIFEK